MNPVSHKYVDPDDFNTWHLVEFQKTELSEYKISGKVDYWDVMTERRRMKKWVMENCVHEHTTRLHVNLLRLRFWFFDAADAVAFKMYWK